MTKNPERRLGSDDENNIKRHHFFSSIDWDRLERREIEPSFRPQVKGHTDTQNFEDQFTNETPGLTPIEQPISNHQQSEFAGFSYVNEEEFPSSNLSALWYLLCLSLFSLRIIVYTCINSLSLSLLFFENILIHITFFFNKLLLPEINNGVHTPL